MWYKEFFKVFLTIFIAELGDKTQLATMLFAASKESSPWLIFIAASLALMVAAGLGTLFGGAIAQFVPMKILRYVAGAGFILIGIYTLFRT